MHPAVKPDACTILTNQAEPTRQAGAFGATKLKTLSNFLDGESVDHSPDATKTGVSTTSQEGGCSPLFRGITCAITDAIRLAGSCPIHSYGGPHSPNCGRACVCRPRNQSNIRPGGSARQEGGEGWQEGLAQYRAWPRNVGWPILSRPLRKEGGSVKAPNYDAFISRSITLRSALLMRV